MLRTESNPGELPIDVFHGIRTGVQAGRTQFFKDLSASFYGSNRSGSSVSQGLRDSFWMQGMQSGLTGVLECIKAFSETDSTEGLKRIDVPTLIFHGDDDKIVPIADSAILTAKPVKKVKLKVYPGAQHGLCSTHNHAVNTDLPAFLLE